MYVKSEPSFRKYNIDDAVCVESANEKFDLEPVSLCAVNVDKAPYYLREAQNHVLQHLERHIKRNVQIKQQMVNVKI